jgi:hypothetical protein
MEADRATHAIRDVLKESGKLSREEHEFTVLRPVKLTEAERTDFANYQPGEIIQFHQKTKGFDRREKVSVKSADLKCVRVARANGKEAILPLEEASKFQVYRPTKLSIAEGDKIRITQNGYVPDTHPGIRGGKIRLNNGTIFDVEGFTGAGDIRLTNGTVIPKDYGSFTHGFVVTSHASQGKTVDKVLVALGSDSFAAANREQLYVSVSRGRESVKLYTDDKERVFEAVQGTSARLSATELMQAQNTELLHQKATARRRQAQLRQMRSHNGRRERNAARDLVEALNKYQQKESSHGRY